MEAENEGGSPLASTSTASQQSPADVLGQYAEVLALHQGRHSTVWSATDAKGVTVVIKAYYKQKMKIRHARHVLRETRLLQVFRDSR